MDLPFNFNRPSVDQDPIYEEVLAAFTENLSEIELLKLFIKYSYHMYVDDHHRVIEIQKSMQENYAKHILPNVVKLLHTSLEKPTNLGELINYRRERMELLNELLSPLAKPRFNQVFYKKLRKEDPWGKDTILMEQEGNDVEVPMTFVDVANDNNNDGGPSSPGGEGVAQDNDPTGV